MSGGLPGGRHAAVIGINAYGNGIATLSTAVPDARAVAAALERDQGYAEPIELLDEAASLDGIVELLERTLPALGLAAGGGLVLYFAGHGVAFDDDQGPQGYLIPWDARCGEPETWLPMDRVRRALGRLPCRHLLVVLDCCFAGSFRWASSRKLLLPDMGPLYDSQYARYLEGEAWQVLTSASHQEVAQDVAPGSRNHRDREAAEEHSPFAAAFLKGLAGGADSSRGEYGADGVITATELYQYVFEKLAPAGRSRRQTPGLWPLKPANTGEFIFHHPGRSKNTRLDPPLDKADNPWLGLAAYGDRDAPLFFGRERVVEALLDRLHDDSRPPLLAVVGASGTGKSSVVKAGVLPRLQAPAADAESSGAWQVVICERLGKAPGDRLDEAWLRLQAMTSPAEPIDRRQLLVIDQFEELFTQGSEPDAQRRFLERLAALLAAGDLRVLITLRSDFEPRLADTPLDPWLEARGAGTRPGGAPQTCDRRPGCFRVPPFSSDELRQVIEGPAAYRAMYFEPPELVDRLVDEVMAMPGGLPLLSFALAEMYRCSVLRRRASGALDRSLNEDDYRDVGGVVGSLHRRATQLYDDAGGERREVIRRLFLRLVSPEGGRLVRRRVEDAELVYAAHGAPEQVLVDEVCGRYVDARLLVADEGYVEPAHDTLVLAWEKLRGWLRQCGSQELQRQLWQAAAVWHEARGREGPRRAEGLLWSEDPRLPQVQAMRGELNRLERRFVDASGKHQRRRRFWFAARVTAAFIAVAALAVYALHKAGAEAEARRLADAQRQKAEAAALLAEERRQQAEVERLRAEAQQRVADAERQRAERERDRADEQQRRADRQRRVADDTALVAVAGGRMMEDPTQAALVLLEVVHPDAAADAIPTMLEVLSQPLYQRVLWHKSSVLDAAFGTGGRVVTAHRNGEVREWRAAGAEPATSGELVALLEHEGAVDRAAFDAAGTRVVTVSGRVAWVWSLDRGGGAGEPVPLLGHEGAVLSAAFDAAGARVVTASSDRTARVWDVDGAAGRPPVPRVLAGHDGAVLGAAFDRAGTRVVTASSDRSARVWSLDPAVGESLALEGHGGAVLSAAFDAAGSRVVTASEDRTARVWNVSGAGRVVVLEGHDDRVSSAAFDPAGTRVVTVSRDKTARLWNADGSGESRVLRGHGNHLLSAAFNSDGSRILTVGGDQTVRIWNLTGTGEDQLLRRREDGFASVAFNTAGTRMVTTSGDAVARIWTVGGAAGRPTGESSLLEGHRGKVLSVAFDAGGTRIVTTSADRTARIWNTGGSGEPVVLEGHHGAVRSAAFDATGTRVVTASEDRTARVWNLDRGQGRTAGEPVVLEGHEGAVSSAAFDAAGTRVVTGSADGTARVWNVTGTGRVVVMREHRDRVVSVAFDATGTRVLSASRDGAVRLWNADGTGRAAALRGHQAPLLGAAFSAGGTEIHVTSQGGVTRVWPITGDRLQAAIREATAACLSPDARVRYLGEPRGLASEKFADCRCGDL